MYFSNKLYLILSLFSWRWWIRGIQQGGICWTCHLCVSNVPHECSGSLTEFIDKSPLACLIRNDSIERFVWSSLNCIFSFYVFYFENCVISLVVSLQNTSAHFLLQKQSINYQKQMLSKSEKRRFTFFVRFNYVCRFKFKILKLIFFYKTLYIAGLRPQCIGKVR